MFTSNNQPFYQYILRTLVFFYFSYTIPYLQHFVAYQELTLHIIIIDITPLLNGLRLLFL